MDDLDTQEGVYLVQQQLWALQVRSLGAKPRAAHCEYLSVLDGALRSVFPHPHIVQMDTWGAKEAQWDQRSSERSQDSSCMPGDP